MFFKKKAAWLRQVTVFVCAFSLVYAAQVTAQMCPADHLGGVTLNKTLTLLNDLEDLQAAVYDPFKGEMVFIGQGRVPVDERIDMDDLVAAVKSVYVSQQDPGVTFYTANEQEAYRTGYWDVSYLGSTRNTQFGQIMQYQNGLNVVLNAGLHQVLHYVTFKLYDPYMHGLNDFYSTPSPNGLNPEAQADWYMYNYFQNK